MEQQQRSRSMSEIFTSNLAGSSTEVVVLKELIKSLTGIKYDGLHISFMKSIIGCLGRVVGIFMIQYLAQNPSKIFTILKGVMISLLYKKISVSYLAGTLGGIREGIISDQLRGLFIGARIDNGITEIYNNMFPILLFTDSSHDHISYMPFIHTSLIEEKVNIANKKYEEIKRVKDRVNKA